MTRSDYLSGKFRAHAQLAHKHGTASDMRFDLSSTSFVTSERVLSSEGDMSPAVIEIPVNASLVARIQPASDLKHVGRISWYEPGIPKSADYLVEDGKTPSLFRVVSDPPGDDDRPKVVTTPMSTADKALAAVEANAVDFIEGLEDRSLENLSREGSRFISDGVGRAISDVKFLIGRFGETVHLAVPADLPFYRVVKQLSRTDPARCEVDIRRNFDTEGSDWSFGMQFEPWEAAIAHDLVVAYGERRFGPPRELSPFAERAWDMAIMTRMGMNSLLPLFLKKAMLDLRQAGMHGSYVEDATSAVYSAVAKNDWTSTELSDALSHLDDLWRVNERLSDFTKSKGWDVELSPFSVMAARVEAFPWRHAPKEKAEPDPRPGV